MQIFDSRVYNTLVGWKSAVTNMLCTMDDDDDDDFTVVAWHGFYF